MTDRVLTGRCLCGVVSYQVPDAFEYAMNCHCSRCRKTTGSAFKAMAGIRSDRIVLTGGVDQVRRYGDANAHDLHCRSCGSLLYSLVREGEYVHVAMGTLIDQPSLTPTHHIFVGSKAPWFQITDSLPQFDELPEA